MTELNRNINSFIAMIEKTNYYHCNKDFHKQLNTALLKDTSNMGKLYYSTDLYVNVENMMDSWNKCSQKEVIKKMNSLQK